MRILRAVDRAREYLPLRAVLRFLRVSPSRTAERGDLSLNPLDARSPYWSPGDEWRHEAETLTLATSLFQDRRHENTFFTEAPRRIFAHLLTLRPTPEQLAWWLCHEDEIDRRLTGTAYAAMIDRQAPHQRSGELASLNMVADPLKLVSAERDTICRWSAAEWAFCGGLAMKRSSGLRTTDEL